MDEKNEEIFTVEFRITGRVQYVMFRDFTKRNATKMGLTGFVKNNKDGSVTVRAEGEKVNVALLEKELLKGPIFAKVTSVIKNEEPQHVGKRRFNNFEIMYE